MRVSLLDGRSGRRRARGRRARAPRRALVVAAEQQRRGQKDRRRDDSVHGGTRRTASRRACSGSTPAARASATRASRRSPRSARRRRRRSGVPARVGPVEHLVGQQQRRQPRRQPVERPTSRCFSFALTDSHSSLTDAASVDRRVGRRRAGCGGAACRRCPATTSSKVNSPASSAITAWKPICSSRSPSSSRRWSGSPESIASSVSQRLLDQVAAQRLVRLLPLPRALGAQPAHVVAELGRSGSGTRPA